VPRVESQNAELEAAYGELKRQHAELAALHRDLKEEVRQRRRAEESLQAALDQWQNTFDAARDAICVLSPEHRVLRCNQAMAKLLGRSPEEVVGRDCRDVMDCWPGHSQACFLARVKDGRERTTTILRNGDRWFSAVADPIVDEAGKVAAIIHVLSDITARKKADDFERELAAQRVLSIAADRLRSLGEMAAAVAHELKQPLVGVRGLAEHLLISVEKGWDTSPEKLREKLKLIMEQADRMTHIIEQVRMFAREAGKPEVRPVDINEVVRAAAGMVGAHLRVHGITLDCVLADGLPDVSANPYSLEEVVVNLITNSRDAVLARMAPAAAASPRPIVLRTLSLLREGRTWVQIEVIDQGVGIPEDALPRLFQPFFTTKGPDQGTGIGLAVCKQIVEQFGGTIAIRSQAGCGTTVTLSLPVRV
jgi:histidine kinase